MSKPGMFWRRINGGEKNDSLICGLCPHGCVLNSGVCGLCNKRRNMGGELVSESYGQISSMALDPIEKKPLHMFYPGAMILSIGSLGCNFRCQFCQNHEIAMGHVRYEVMTPEQITNLAQETVSHGNIGVAYTYNEPLIGYEFVYDCSRLIRDAGLKNVIVTNGFINQEPLEALLPCIDAMNIDLKGFTDKFYKKINGNLESVKNTIALASDSCHVEVTTLVIPGENEEDVEPIARWLAGINPSIPLHLSRFFPRHQYEDREATSRDVIIKSAESARKHLKHVFTGNM